MLHLHDGLNVIHRRLELDPMGRAPRRIITDMLHHSDSDVHVWAFEGKNHLASRRAIHPGYKDRPSTKTTGFFDLVRLIRSALEHTKAIQVDVPGYEADDVIGHVVCKQAGVIPMTIHTTDRDMNQLSVLPGVKTDAKDLPGVQPADVRLYKTFVGDTSDRIPGLRGFGDESWAKVDKAKLRIAFDNPDQGLYVDAGLSPRLAAKAVADDALLKGFWEIVGFLPIDPNDVVAHMKPGKPDEAKADAILREFYH